jgi:hypothetical protein
MHDDDPTQPVESVPVPVSEPAPDAKAAVVPEFAAPTVPAETTPAGSVTPPPARGSKMAIVGQVVGIAGIVVCLALAVGVLLGRGWAVDQVTSVSATIDENLAKGVPLLDSASTKVSDVQEQVAALEAAAVAVTGNPNPAPALANALSERLSGVSERYLELRTTYATARENIVSAVQRLQMLDRLVPGIEIPQGPIDALAALDERVQELDASLSGIIGPNGVVDSIQGAAQRIAERIDQADELLARAEAALVEAQARLTETRARVASTADTITTGISIGSLVMVVVFLYLALLHWILFRHSSERRSLPAA